MGKWVIGFGSSKIKPIPFNNRVYRKTGMRPEQLFPYPLNRVGSGSEPNPLTGLPARCQPGQVQLEYFSSKPTRV